MIPGYPPELGGRNATPIQTLIYLEELARGASCAACTSAGTPSLRRACSSSATTSSTPGRAAIRGDTVWCVGMCEPDAGSDLAKLTTRAERDGDPFVVNGQKVWTSYAMVAAKCFCYVRTTPLDGPKHKGISVLIIDMDTPGIEVRPLKHITGPRIRRGVLHRREVPVANLVGALNDGWRITMGSLAHERGGLW